MPTNQAQIAICIHKDHVQQGSVEKIRVDCQISRVCTIASSCHLMTSLPAGLGNHRTVGGGIHQFLDSCQVLDTHFENPAFAIGIGIDQ